MGSKTQPVVASRKKPPEKRSPMDRSEPRSQVSSPRRERKEEENKKKKRRREISKSRDKKRRRRSRSKKETIMATASKAVASLRRLKCGHRHGNP